MMSPISLLRLQADSQHVLAKGDTLYSISKKYDVSVNLIIRANGIADPSALSIGSILTIPNTGPNGESTVEKAPHRRSVS